MGNSLDQVQVVSEMECLAANEQRGRMSVEGEASCSPESLLRTWSASSVHLT